ncbi:uncharacterized protein LOC122624707 [Drosophila teissieri]|uniref:uncharacterized protein LOC122624707 n=1 Tax=Drosophila teissieri TaxID=7243 RepID=UPI001CBA0DBB|nr:uncharacterized protein LOC122624707 [Drosophila teissieri]
MPNKSKASPAGSNETRSSSPDEFLMQEQPHQPRGSSVESIETEDSPSDMVDQSTQTQVLTYPALRSDAQFHGRVRELLRALNSILAKKLMRAIRNNPGIIASDLNDITLQLGMLGLNNLVPPEEDLTGDQTVVPELQPEQNPYGEPLAKQKKLETSTTHGPSSEPFNNTNVSEKHEKGSMTDRQDQESHSAHRDDHEMA